MPKKEKNENIEVKNTVEQRPWGWFETVAVGDKYKVKRLFIKKGQRISLQSHDQRDEHWVIVEGFGVIEIDENERAVGQGGHIFVPKKHKHRITATKDMLIVEIQLGVCEEKDIRRYEDDYGRV